MLFCSDDVFAETGSYQSDRAVFTVPTCCSWGELNVEQANRRNAFKAALIELDGLQSQKQSVSTRLRLASPAMCLTRTHH